MQKVQWSAKSVTNHQQSLIVELFANKFGVKVELAIFYWVLRILTLVSSTYLPLADGQVSWNGCSVIVFA